MRLFWVHENKFPFLTQQIRKKRSCLKIIRKQKMKIDTLLENSLYFYFSENPSQSIIHRLGTELQASMKKTNLHIIQIMTRIKKCLKWRNSNEGWAKDNLNTLLKIRLRVDKGSTESDIIYYLIDKQIDVKGERIIPLVKWYFCDINRLDFLWQTGNKIFC